MSGLRELLEAAGVYVQPYNENGPASAATDPDLGSNNPSDGIDMNVQTNTTPPTDAATEQPADKMHRLARELCAAMRENADAPHHITIFADPGISHPIAYAEGARLHSSEHCGIFTMGRLQAIKPRDLHNLTEALYTVSSLLGGFLSQPRFFDDEEHEYVGGGQLLDDLTEMVNRALDDARRAARLAKVETEEDAEYKAWCEIFGHAAYADDLMSTAHLALNALQASRDIATSVDGAAA